MDAVPKFFKTGEFVVRTCVCMITTVKACWKFPQHRRFVGFEEDSMCFLESPPSPVEVLARQFLNPDSVSVGTEKLEEPCKMFIKAIEAIF